MNNRKYFDGYFIMPWEFGAGLVMVLTGPWKDAYADIINSEGISALRLSQCVGPQGGWKDEDISFVSELHQLRGIEVYSWKVKDISPIQNLKNLENIGLQCEFKKSIDFSVFRNLMGCFLRWMPKCDSLFSCHSLKTLNIEWYPYQDLSSLKRLTKLERLQLSSRKLESLSGIESLKKLQVLDLFACSKLSSLVGIEALSCLKILEITTCKRFHDLTPVGRASRLEKFFLNNCGNIDSLSPLRGCKELSELLFIESTNIIDGDMSVFKALPKLRKMRFANRKHYSHTREEIQEILRF